MTRQHDRPLLAILSASAMLATLASTVVGQAPIVATQAHQVIAGTYYNTFSRMHPVLRRVRPGDTVTTETLDSSGRDKNGDRRGGRVADAGSRAWVVQSQAEGQVARGGRIVQDRDGNWFLTFPRGEVQHAVG